MFCKTRLVRGMRRDGFLERPSGFRRRLFCNRRCAMLYLPPEDLFTGGTSPPALLRVSPPSVCGSCAAGPAHLYRSGDYSADSWTCLRCGWDYFGPMTWPGDPPRRVILGIEGGNMATVLENVEDTLERLRKDLPSTFSMEWLDEHREDAAKALAEVGLSSVSTALGVSINTLKTWRRRRGLSPQGGSHHQEDTPLVYAGASGATVVALDLIEDNPWQPRKTIELDDLEALAGSIGTSGLLQVPIGRLRTSGRVQLAFGHRRVAAIRLLAEAGKWEGGAPIVLKELTDQQMALFALEENAKRKDINQLEQYLGYQKVVQDNLLSVTELADSVGLARSTVSNNLRILNLPGEALEHFRNGNLSAHAARELLVLWAPDHDHTDDISAILRSIENTYSYDGSPDWSVKAVRKRITDRVRSGKREGWRPLYARETNTAGGSYIWSSSGSSYDLPTFDIEAFAKEHPTKVHNIPTSEQGATAWTCHVREWRRLQSAATRAETKAMDEPPKLRGEETEVYLQALAHDPVMQAVKAGGPLASAPADVSMETPPGTEIDPKGAGYQLLNDWIARYLAHSQRDEEGLDCDYAATPDECPLCGVDEDSDGVSGEELLTPAVLRARFDLGLLTDHQIETAVERGVRKWDGRSGPRGPGRTGSGGRPHSAGAYRGTGARLGLGEGTTRDPCGVSATVQGPPRWIRQASGPVPTAQRIRRGGVQAALHVGRGLRTGVLR